MRIAVISYNQVYPQRVFHGSAREIFDFSLESSSSGHSLLVFSLEKWDQKRSYTRFDDVNFLLLPVTGPWRIVLGLLRWLRYKTGTELMVSVSNLAHTLAIPISYTRRLKAVMVKFKPEVILCEDLKVGLLSIELVNVTSAAFVVRFHEPLSLLENQSHLSFVNRILERKHEKIRTRIINAANVILTGSPSDVEAFSKKYGKEAAYIGEGIRCTRYVPDESFICTLGLKEKIYCLFVGSNSGDNRWALSMISAVAPQIPKMRFAIAGPVSETIGDDHPPNLLPLGRISSEKLQALYENSAMVLAPTPEDAWYIPVKVMEGIAYGKPVVTTEAGIRLLPGLEHLTNCYLTGYSPKELKRALTELMNHPELLEDIGRGALEYYSTHMSWKEPIKRFQDLLERAISTRGLIRT